MGCAGGCSRSSSCRTVPPRCPSRARGGMLELEQRGDGARAGCSCVARLPVEAAALLAAGAGRGGAWPAPAGAGLRITAGEVAEAPVELDFDAGRRRDPRPARRPGIRQHRRPLERPSASTPRARRRGGHWRLRLEGREAALRAPGLESLPQPLQAALDGEARELKAASPAGRWRCAGWRCSSPTRPALRIAGSAGTDAAVELAASCFEIDLAAPLPRAAMALPQAALQPLLAASFWRRSLRASSRPRRLELVDGRWGAAESRCAR